MIFYIYTTYICIRTPEQDDEPPRRSLMDIVQREWQEQWYTEEDKSKNIYKIIEQTKEQQNSNIEGCNIKLEQQKNVFCSKSIYRNNYSIRIWCRVQWQKITSITDDTKSLTQWINECLLKECDEYASIFVQECAIDAIQIYTYNSWVQQYDTINILPLEVGYIQLRQIRYQYPKIKNLLYEKQKEWRQYLIKCIYKWVDYIIYLIYNIKSYYNDKKKIKYIYLCIQCLYILLSEICNERNIIIRDEINLKEIIIKSLNISIYQICNIDINLSIYICKRVGKLFIDLFINEYFGNDTIYEVLYKICIYYFYSVTNVKEVKKLDKSLQIKKLVWQCGGEVCGIFLYGIWEYYSIGIATNITVKGIEGCETDSTVSMNLLLKKRLLHYVDDSTTTTIATTTATAANYTDDEYIINNNNNSNNKKVEKNTLNPLQIFKTILQLIEYLNESEYVIECSMGQLKGIKMWQTKYVTQETWLYIINKLWILCGKNINIGKKIDKQRYKLGSDFWTESWLGVPLCTSNFIISTKKYIEIDTAETLDQWYSIVYDTTSISNNKINNNKFTWDKLTETQIIWLLHAYCNTASPSKKSKKSINLNNWNEEGTHPLEKNIYNDSTTQIFNIITLLCLVENEYISGQSLLCQYELLNQWTDSNTITCRLNDIKELILSTSQSIIEQTTLLGYINQNINIELEDIYIELKHSIIKYLLRISLIVCIIIDKIFYNYIYKIDQNLQDRIKDSILRLITCGGIVHDILLYNTKQNVDTLTNSVRLEEQQIWGALPNWLVNSTNRQPLYLLHDIIIVQCVGWEQWDMIRYKKDEDSDIKEDIIETLQYTIAERLLKDSDMQSTLSTMYLNPLALGQELYQQNSILNSNNFRIKQQNQLLERLYILEDAFTEWCIRNKNTYTTTTTATIATIATTATIVNNAVSVKNTAKCINEDEFNKYIPKLIYIPYTLQLYNDTKYDEITPLYEFLEISLQKDEKYSSTKLNSEEYDQIILSYYKRSNSSLAEKLAFENKVCIYQCTYIYVYI